jgi:hypothetical protein
MSASAKGGNTMSDRVICPNCGHSNSKHRVTCKKCRANLAQAIAETIAAEQPLPAGAGEATSGSSAREEKAIESLSKAVAKELAEGKNKGKIVRSLEKQGWPRESAVQLVGNVERAAEEYKRSPEGRRAMAEKYKRHMLYGILWAVGGIIVTAITYNTASPGGTYIIAWGAILFGIVDFLRGLIGWLKYQG